jgi:predicted membrane protein
VSFLLLGVENSFEWRLRKKCYFSLKMTGITCQFFLLLSLKKINFKNKTKKASIKQQDKILAHTMH